MKKLFLFVLFSLLFVLNVNAQTVINPTRVEFNPSPDHNAVRLDGTAVVTNYELNAVAMNNTGAIAITVNLLKPTPNSAGLIIVPVSQFATLVSNALYTATVTAKGPDGVGVSAPSNPFGKSAPQPPGSPTNVLVK